jgi:hypothetical protein
MAQSRIHPPEKSKRLAVRGREGYHEVFNRKEFPCNTIAAGLFNFLGGGCCLATATSLLCLVVKVKSILWNV